ncbi:MAG: type II and III secretion system protein, partial [bacterium]|nr:type II and III secretion system protein [bacterium]
QQDDNTVISGQQYAAGEPGEKDVGVFEITHFNNNTEINAMLKALESNDVGEVIANPNIVVADGRTGRVQIGQDFSIKQRDFAGNVTDKFVSTGIILLVTPNIIIDDSLRFVHLFVQTERSSAMPGAITTIINKTQANTEMLINDGEKVGIGGLFLTEENINRNGLPLLKNIPKWFFGLGYLFGYDSRSKVEKELIILLNAEIIPILEARLIT